jgi:hypothetical protein
VEAEGPCQEVGENQVAASQPEQDRVLQHDDG